MIAIGVYLRRQTFVQKSHVKKFNTQIQLYVKSLKEGWNHGVDPSLTIFLIKSALARETFGTPSFHLSNFERIFKIKNRGMRIGPVILVAIKPIFNSPTPLFVYGNLSIKRTWVTLC